MGMSNGKRSAHQVGVCGGCANSMSGMRLSRLIRALRIPFRYDTDALGRAYSPASAITHRFDVRRFAARKQAALAAHVSDVRGTGRLAPVLRVLVWLPAPVFALVAGREWYVDVTRR